MLERDVVPGVHRVEDAGVNWYLVEGDDGAMTIVDAGLPASWRSLRGALFALGRSLDDIGALVLTHAHFDHIGFAQHAHDQLGLSVWLHERDASLARHPFHHERERSLLRYPLGLPVGYKMARAGVLRTRPLTEVRGFSDEEVLDVPGALRPVFTPGHTHGHTAFFLPDRDVVIAGDALVTFNPYRNRSGPQLVSGAATADEKGAVASLQRLAETGARVLLPGHGPPWRGGVEVAVEQARETGPS